MNLFSSPNLHVERPTCVGTSTRALLVQCDHQLPACIRGAQNQGGILESSHLSDELWVAIHHLDKSVHFIDGVIVGPRVKVYSARGCANLGIECSHVCTYSSGVVRADRRTPRM